MRSQRGFALMEVMLAGAIAIGIIFALFTAIQQAGNQTKFIDGKKDERNLLGDLKYVLQNPTLCKDRFDVTKEFRIGDEVKIGVRQDLQVGKDTKLAGYGVKVDSLKVIDTLQITEDRQFDSTCVKNGTVTEHLETSKGKLVLVSPDPKSKDFQKIEACKGQIKSYQKKYYTDLQIEASPLNDKKVHFRPERLSRVTVIRNWDRDNGNSEGCTGVSTGSDNIAPMDFAQRVGGATVAGAGSSTVIRGTPGEKRPPADPRYDHTWQVDEEKPRELASLTMPAPEAAPAPAPAAPAPVVEAPAPPPPPAPPPVTQQDCVVNGTLEQAQRYGWPTIKPGEHIRFESGECEEREYFCYGGNLVDAGLPPMPVKGCVPSKHL